MTTDNSATVPAYLSYLRHQPYLPPAPPIDEKVAPAYWAHQCAVSGKEEWDFWHGGPHTCKHGCGYKTNPTTILRNRDGQQLETIEGENLLEDRFVDWWAICCRCQRWQQNVLPAHPLHGRIQKVNGENCCDHCRNLTTSTSDCTSCLAITKYREVTRTLSGVDIPGAARSRHHQIIITRRQQSRPRFNFGGELSAGSTIGDEENKNQKADLEDIEKMKECRNDEEENGKKEQGKERKGDDEKVSQASG
ncbi:hypothetical protein QC763_105005 [Podospora pseudopauciseta]|uniref:Stc1 domain-containing protein n=1 Tax=Podospora pseudopauciseta TaxID=2093780 RepID=A0ABR0HXN2_9PEZI|nr:hypothetical protein QC763_105005 [Podospora pseudopauciseta]